jgi:hypothetical protein
MSSRPAAARDNAQRLGLVRPVAQRLGIVPMALRTAEAWQIGLEFSWTSLTTRRVEPRVVSTMTVTGDQRQAVGSKWWLPPSRKTTLTILALSRPPQAERTSPASEPAIDVQVQVLRISPTTSSMCR